MTAFFDTSSLFKLYHREEGSQALMDYFVDEKISQIFLADITIVEFNSVIWKKCRIGELTPELAKVLLDRFIIDCSRYSFIDQDSTVMGLANEMMAKHWTRGLRALDALQLASVIMANTDRLFCADRVLAEVARAEGIEVF